MAPIPGRNPFTSHHGQLFEAWRAAQVGLGAVLRFEKYAEMSREAFGQGLRSHTSLEHSHSVTLLARIMVHRCRPYLAAPFDEMLLTDAVLVHDHGEGYIGEDTAYLDKNAEKDLAEYLAFCQAYESLGSIWTHLHRAFLLQFALKNPSNFPFDARIIMAELASVNYMEARMFQAVERFDYLLYPYEHYERDGNPWPLVWTLRNQAKHLDRLAAETPEEGGLPGFRQEFWTPEISSWWRRWLEQFEGQHIEQSG